MVVRYRLDYIHEYSGDSTQLLYLRSRMYSPKMARFTSKDSWLGEYNRPHSLNRWLYGYGNPVKYTDPSGYLSIPQITEGFKLSTIEEVADLFRPSGRLRGKWGYLAFLFNTSIGEYGHLWKETGKVYEDYQGQNFNGFWRPDSDAHPCPVHSHWTSGCYQEGRTVTSGEFSFGIDGLSTWVDWDTGAENSLMELGLLDADWYFPSSTDTYYLPQGFYAYEWYPLEIGYDWSKVNKLSTSTNLAGILTPCALSCPEGGPLCIIGLLSGLWTITGGTVSLVADANKVSSGDLNSIDDLGLDVCSTAPVYGSACSYGGYWMGLEAGDVYIIP